jgi:hypothetical protein
LNVQAAGEHRKGRRRMFVQPGNQLRVVGEKLQRTIIEAGQAVAQVCGARIGDDGRDDFGGRHVAFEYRA